MLFGHGGAAYWFPVCRGSGGVLQRVEGEQMSSHMEEPRRNAAHLGWVGGWVSGGLEGGRGRGEY